MDKTRTEETGRIPVETVEVAGHQLVERVQELAQESSVRRLRIVAEDGDVILQTPLSIGLAVGSVVALAAPWLAILGAIAARVGKINIEIERTDAEDGVSSDAS